MAALLIGVGLSACDPPPPPPVVLVVTTDATGSDAAPGDGVCEVTAAAGDCSLRAALQEGSALGRADISVPDGDYSVGDVTVSGVLRVNHDRHAVTLLSATITVAAGASLTVEGVQTPVTLISADVDLVVEGTLVVVDSLLARVGQPVVNVRPTGTAVLDTVGLLSLWNPAVFNQGTLAVLRSTLVGVSGPALQTHLAGRSFLSATLLETGAFRFPQQPACTGTAPTSGGYVMAVDSSCGLTGATDQQDVVLASEPGGGVIPTPGPGSPLVDAIPAGSATCPAGGHDLYGASRPVDGDGDGVASCDVGATELVPTP